MEGLVVQNRVVGEVDEGPLNFPDSTAQLNYLEQLSRHSQYGDELYGVALALEYGIDSPELATYFKTQEATHIQEGIELAQQDATDFVFDGDFVCSPLNNEPMQKIAEEGLFMQQALLREGSGHKFMEQRLSHDIAIAKDNDHRMKHSPIGAVWARFSPYAQEESRADAEDAGFWPETKRAFVWMYRKKDENTLEATIITIDQSEVVAFAGVMHEYGADVPTTITSHDMPALVVEIAEGIQSEPEIGQVIEELKVKYRKYANELELPELNMGSKEFIETYCQEEIHSLVRLQQEVLLTLEKNELTSYTKASIAAVLGENFITEAEREQIMKLYNSSKPQNFVEALRLVLRAHRYGSWGSINQKLEYIKRGNQPSQGVQVNPATIYPDYIHQQNYIVGQEVKKEEVQQMHKIADSAQQAAEQGKVKPGCSGGSSFLSQGEGEAKESIFGGKENDPKRWMSCPFCKKKEAVKARVCDTNLKCRHCEAEVKAGKVVNKGKVSNQQPKSTPADTSAAISLQQKRSTKREKEVQVAQNNEVAEATPTHTVSKVA